MTDVHGELGVAPNLQCLGNRREEIPCLASNVTGVDAASLPRACGNRDEFVGGRVLAGRVDEPGRQSQRTFDDRFASHGLHQAALGFVRTAVGISDNMTSKCAVSDE